MLLYQGWRAWDFSHCWAATEAKVIGSDYSEAERSADREPFAWLRPRPFTDARSGRWTEVRIEYADGAGEVHRATLKTIVTRGKTVKPAFRVFYDRRDPDRVVQGGTLGAMVGLLFWSAFLTMSLRAMAMGPA